MIDPEAFSIFGLSIRWYGLLWVAGFGFFFLVCRNFGAEILGNLASARALDDILFFGALGALVGGRLGYVLFYAPDLYYANPSLIVKIWHGGMSFHGGLLGAFVGLNHVARKHRIELLRVADLAALGVPLGLACGRLGNFINGELWGRVTELPWGLVFPSAGSLPRHPSQLYELLIEGLLLFVVLLQVQRRRPVPGMLSAVFLLGYGLGRFGIEFFRAPDSHLGLLALNLSMGQWLCLPIIVVGGVLTWALRSQAEPPIVHGKVRRKKSRDKKKAS